jgi:hypothetical protein
MQLNSILSCFVSWTISTAGLYLRLQSTSIDMLNEVSVSVACHSDFIYKCFLGDLASVTLLRQMKTQAAAVKLLDMCCILH